MSNLEEYFKLEKCFKLEEYFELDKKRTGNLSKQAASIYSLMAVERQWKVYEKAASGYSWGRSNIYRRLLDQCWDAVLGNKIMEEKLWNICYDNKPENVIADDDRQIDDLFQFCSIFADTLEMLIDDLCETGCTSGFTFYNFKFLDGFIGDYLELGTNLHDNRGEIIGNHELGQLEVMRQNRDFEKITSCDNLGELRKWCLKQCNESILGDYWFDEMRQL